jgi:hypothetical protein
MSRTSCLARALLAGVAGAALLVVSPVPSSLPPAAAQGVVISAEFRTALAPYGTWRRVPRWGEVWIPARVSRDWRPYSVGHWVYTEDYGWYWIAAEEEAEWGWVTFHYGRWVLVEPYGWVWVPGNVWGPAWVDWRYGDEYVGWAPLPPDEIIVEYRADPTFWMFVRVVDLIAPRPRYVFVSFPERRRIWQQTALVNSTVLVSERRFAVNPGISPVFVAARARQPLRTFTVRPQVVAGTANIQGAVQVREQDLRRAGDRPGRVVLQQRSVQQAATTVQPAQNAPPPRALAPNERGRLGDNPPRAATGAQERGTNGAAPGQRDERDRAQPPGTSPGQAPTGAAPREPRRDGTAPGAASGDDRQRTQERGAPGSPPGTTGVGPQRRDEPRGGQGPAMRQERGPGQDRMTPQAPGTTGQPPVQRRDAPSMRDNSEMPERGTSRPPGTTGAAPPTPRREALPLPDERDGGMQRGGPRVPGPSGSAPPVQQREAPAPRLEPRQQAAPPPPQTPAARPPVQQSQPQRPPQPPAAQQRQAPQPPATTGSGPQREESERGR